MTTWASLISAPKGNIVIVLEITGLQYTFSTSTQTITDSWYTSGGYLGNKPWLQWPDLTIREKWEPIDGHIQVGSIRLEVADVDDQFTAQVKSWRSRNWTRLTSTVDNDDLSFSVADGSALNAGGGYFWIDQECVRYTGVSGSTVTADLRGAFGTEARAHTVDTALTPPRMPKVLDGPNHIVGRRANVYAAVIDASDGSIGATTCIYRGYIKQGLRVGQGSWAIQVEHIVNFLLEPFGSALPRHPVEQDIFYWQSLENSGRGFIDWSYGGDFVRDDYSGTQYANLFDLQEDINDNFVNNTPSVTRYPILRFEGDRWNLQPNSSPSLDLRLRVRRGDPLWILGFEEGWYLWPNGIISTEEGYVWVAEDAPRVKVYVELDWYNDTGGTITAEVPTNRGSTYTAGLPVQLGENPWVKLNSIATDTLTLDLHDIDRTGFHGEDRLDEWKRQRIIIDAGENVSLQQIWPFFEYDNAGTEVPRDLVNAMKAALGQQAGVLEPKEWTLLGIESGDVNWDELTDAIAGFPDDLVEYDAAFQQAMSFSEIFGARLGLLGIAPRITTDAKIGFARLDTPTEELANAVEIDSDLYSLDDVTGVEISIESEPLVNHVHIELHYDYVHQAYGHVADLIYHDGLNEHGRTRRVTYKDPGLGGHSFEGSAVDTDKIIATLQGYVYGTHFGMFGRTATTLEIPCTYAAKQLRCGDIVLVTHPVAIDLTAGTTGMTDRLGIIIERVQRITSRGADVLTVLIPPQSNAGNICPCAIATSWAAATKTLTIADYDVYKQASHTSDLSYFSAGQKVQLIPYDTTSGSIVTSGVASTSIAGDGSEAYMTLTSDPFGGSFPTYGVWIVWDTWDNSTEAQQKWAYTADDNQAPTLGSGSDDPKEWGI